MHGVEEVLPGVHPARGVSLAAFMFRGPVVSDFDYRDTEQHKRLLTGAFANRVPELLDRVRVCGDLYFDAVSQVHLDHWSHGRIALLGDAASCVSLFGDGSSIAMAGAATLADELAASPDNHQRAFHRYETHHRAVVTPKQRSVAQASALLVPATRAGIVTRNLVTRLWPIAVAAQRVGRDRARSSRSVAA